MCVCVCVCVRARVCVCVCIADNAQETIQLCLSLGGSYKTLALTLSTETRTSGGVSANDAAAARSLLLDRSILLHIRAIFPPLSLGKDVFKCCG